MTGLSCDVRISPKLLATGDLVVPSSLAPVYSGISVSVFIQFCLLHDSFTPGYRSQSLSRFDDHVFFVDFLW